MRDIEAASTTAGLPVAPALGPALDSVNAPRDRATFDRRGVLTAGLSVGIGIAAALVAQLLTALIGLITNLAFYGRFSTSFVSPADNRLGALVLVVPVIGGLVVGVMARYGSPAIRGHGIPEVMDKVLNGESRIPARLMFLKPVSAAVAIGTGGPFGAEGPIIATGGALGSMVGQVIRVSADERKTLLAAGAAAGMSATFGSPVAAVLLAIELLLFEYRARSVIPVALASAAAAAVRLAMVGNEPAFSIPTIASAGGAALAFYALLGALIGLVAVGVTRAAYAVEDAFERLPIHWMWWPALGAVAVGIIGYFAPRTLGVGYANIDDILSGNLVGRALVVLVVLKFISWAVYLGSGTSGGTLAPLFTIGGGVGGAVGAAGAALLPAAGIDPHVAALVGMAGIFAGASHALLASVVFAFETTRQPMGLLPLLAGCGISYMVSLLCMRNSIMTEKLSRRGAAVRTEFEADILDRVRVGDAAASGVVTLAGADTLERVRAWLAERDGGAEHQGFPVLDDAGGLIGVVTRRDLLDPGVPPSARVADTIRRPPAVVFADQTLRAAADHMVSEEVGRLPVVTRDEPRRVVGIISRSDLLAAHAPRLRGGRRAESGGE